MCGSWMGWRGWKMEALSFIGLMRVYGCAGEGCAEYYKMKEHQKDFMMIGNDLGKE
jgi:hypothetical protein